MGRLNWPEPPPLRSQEDWPLLYEWALQVHKLLSGLGPDAGGSIDDDNVTDEGITHGSKLTGLSADDHLQYHTEGRADTWLGGKTTDDVAEGAQNLYYTIARVDAWFQTKDTDDLAEGVANLYFTIERVDDRVAALIQNGNAITWTYDDGSGTLTGNVTQAAAQTDAVASTVSVDTADADATYGTEERDLINEMKGDINQLVTDVNAITGVVNALVDKLQTAGLMAT